MSAGSLCTRCGKATVLPVATIVTSLQSVSYKPPLNGTVRQRERAYRSPTRKGQILAGSRTPSKKVPGPPKIAHPKARFASIRGKFWNCFSVFAWIGSPVIHTGRKVTHHGLTATGVLGERWVQINLVSLRRQFVPCLLRKAILHDHIATAERWLRKARRFHRGLNVHFIVSQIRNVLRVRLRLVPSAHDAKRHAHIALLREGGNNRMQRPLAPCQHVR